MKVLVVDDSRAMRAYVRGALRGAFDCTVVEVSSGFEALRILPRERFDVAIADINMPDINGLELIRFVRGSERHRGLPLIIISTQAADRDRRRAIELGASEFLAKPFDPDDIVRAVGRLAGGDQER